MSEPISVSGQAFETFPKLTEGSRAKLRGQIPGLTKQLADRVRAKLQPGALFKTSAHILPAVKSEMVENPSQIYGRVYIDQRKFPNVVAHTLETGSRPHDIIVKNASSLFFFWEKLGKNVAFMKVHHPGFAGRSYMQSSLDEMKADLVAGMRSAVVEGLKNP